MLRFAARPQRRAGYGPDARAADDRSDPARPLRRDRLERRRLWLAPAALRAAPRRRSGVLRSGAGLGPEAARYPGMARGAGLPRTWGAAVRRASNGDLPRVLPSGARSED